MSKTNQLIITAFKKGYRIVNGNCIYKGKTRKPKIKNNYLFISGVRDKHGKGRDLPIHRLLAYQKFGNEMFNKGIMVRHLNGNSFDNTDENILIGNNQDNQLDIPVEQRKTRVLNASKQNKKYDNEKVKKFYNLTKSYKDTMLEFNISSKSTLHYILNN